VFDNHVLDLLFWYIDLRQNSDVRLAFEALKVALQPLLVYVTYWRSVDFVDSCNEHMHAVVRFCQIVSETDAVTSVLTSILMVNLRQLVLVWSSFCTCSIREPKVAVSYGRHVLAVTRPTVSKH